MSNFNWCHGPECHEKRTVDRVRGTKGSKVLRTRKVTISSYGNRNASYNYFCSNGCERDFWFKYGNQIRAIAPRTEPLETPIEDPKKTTHTHEYGWGTHSYVTTEITKVDNAS